MRVWEGESEKGVKVKCLIAVVSINKDENIREFEDCLFLNPDVDLTEIADINPWFFVDKVEKE